MSWALIGINSFEITQQLRNDLKNQPSKIIMSFASSAASEHQRAIDTGVDDFLSKLLDTSALLEKVAQRLGLVWDYAVTAKA